MEIDNYFDPGGSHSRNFPTINASYTRNSKRNRSSDEIITQLPYSLYINFKVCNSIKSLKLFSPFKVNDVLNAITHDWKYISTNRERDVITILVMDTINSEKFISTKSLNFDGEDLDVTFEAHAVLNFSKGTIFCHEIIKMSNEEIINNLKDQNVTDIYRFQKRNENNQFFDSGLFVITFKGNFPPKNIKVAYLSIPVSTYYPNPMQCNHCFKLGHTSKKCKNSTLKKACVRCGSVTAHEECEYNCVNCKESHSSKYKGCSEYKKEKAIIKLKIDQNISFTEARRRIVANKGVNSFAEAAGRGELVQIIENLNKKVDLLVKENEELKNSNKLYSTKINELNDGQNNESNENLQQQFDDFKVKVANSTDNLTKEIQQQKKLHKEKIQEHRENIDNLEKQLVKKNALLEDIHSYLLNNNLYPECLKMKGIESLIHNNQKSSDKGLIETPSIEIDDDDIPTPNIKKTSRNNSLDRLAQENIAKIKAGQSKGKDVRVKRLEK